LYVDVLYADVLYVDVLYVDVLYVDILSGRRFLCVLPFLLDIMLYSAIQMNSNTGLLEIQVKTLAIGKSFVLATVF
jgi:hypothetical protein